VASVIFTERPAFVGTRIPRVEDDRLLTGRGRFVADVSLPGCLEVAIVRSQLAHARIVSVGTDGARALPGVVAVFTADDLDGVVPFPHFHTWAREVPRFPLAHGRVRSVGSAVAVVVAMDRYVAEDAVELIELDLEELPVAATIESAMADDAPRLYEDWPDNRIAEAATSDPSVAEIFARPGVRIVRGRYSMPRAFAVPMETRGAAAEHRAGRLTLWTSSQIPHIARTTLAAVLAMPESDIRVVAPDIGGGFGGKAAVYPEEALVGWLAMRLGRPVRWIEDRAEHMVASAHARENVHEIEAAVAEEGTILALRARIAYDVGTQQTFPLTLTPSFTGWAIMTAAYRIPHIEATITNVVTNKTPAGAYRGFGVGEAIFAMERFVDRAARSVGADPVEVRRKMLIGQEDLPMVTPTGVRIDSGSHRESFERAVELGRAALERARERVAGDPSFRVGLGVVPYVDPTVPTWFGTTGHWTAYDSASLRVDPDGTVTAAVGVMTMGQGVETMVATVVAGALGVPLESVRVVRGDTDHSPYGLGSWGSRTTAVSSGAILRAAEVIREKTLKIAGQLLEAAPEDLVIGDGRVHVRGSDAPWASFADIATTATVRTIDLPPGMAPGLEASATYDPPGIDHYPDERGRMNACSTYANAAHAAVVEVDLETGQVEILDYVVVHDCGTVINPMIVEGQAHGAVAQGIGAALYEEMPYDENAQPLATSFMDYLIPSATEIPAMTVDHFETPAPETPFGVKGVGEGGIVGPPAAIAGAVSDALQEFGVDVVDLPITPPKVRRWIAEARSGELADRGEDPGG
jgi:carbon-monoxide dehydrogenase large subunit